MPMYRCAVCGSSRVTPETKKEGYNKARGAVGMALFGLKGAVAGASGNEVVYYHCADCGHTLNKCMSEFEKKDLERCLQNPVANEFVLKNYKQKYRNIEWKEPIKSVSNSNKKVTELSAEEKDKIRQENILVQTYILDTLYESRNRYGIIEICDKVKVSFNNFSCQRTDMIVRRLSGKSTNNIILEIDENGKVYYKANPIYSLDEAKRLSVDEKEKAKIRIENTTQERILTELSILDILYENNNRQFRVSEIVDKINLSSASIGNISQQRVSLILSSLVRKNVIQKIMADRVAYYKANLSYSVEEAKSYIEH